MTHAFEITNQSRKIISELLQNLSLEQLNKIPDGFNNNIIWNIGHIIVVQQMLVYLLSDLPMLVSDEMVQKYKRGTKPEQDVTPSEIAEIQSLLFESIAKTEVDYNSNTFKSYKEFTTMTGFNLKNVEDALAFNYYHEAIHTGVIMGIKKFV